MSRISFRAGVIDTSSFLLIFLLFFYTPILNAGRPLITDDADAIGKDQEQLEIWISGDENSVQHWMVPTVGIGDSIELSAAALQGSTSLNFEEDYSITGPILQAKINFHETKFIKLPGLGFSFGAIPPIGIGNFSSPTWEYFYYLALSNYFLGDDEFLLHLNIGRQTRKVYKDTPAALLWGIALEVKFKEESYFFLEAANSEIYALTPGLVFQTGLRYKINEAIQIDGSIGKGLVGEPLQPVWITLGLKAEGDFL